MCNQLHEKMVVEMYLNMSTVVIGFSRRVFDGASHFFLSIATTSSKSNPKA